MWFRNLSRALAGAVALAPFIAVAQTQTAEPFRFKSVNVDLPNSDRMFPEGPSSDAINSNN
jgi:hypothetical protein